MTIPSKYLPNPKTSAECSGIVYQCSINSQTQKKIFMGAVILN